VLDYYGYDWGVATCYVLLTAFVTVCVLLGWCFLHIRAKKLR
jgi:hypothetical protein